MSEMLLTTEDEQSARSAPLDAGSDRQSTVRRREWAFLCAILGVLALPLVVALVSLHGVGWFPVFDMAMTELRVRDVFTSDSPLIGLPGRIGEGAQQGSHPGPLSFYLLAPLYRLFGSSAWALQVSTAALHLGAIVTALFLARRRGGVPVVIAVGAVLAILVQGYGPGTLTEPWNPWLPVLWFLAFLLATWSVVDRDLAMLPVAVATGSLCAQTHVPYLGVCVSVGGLAAVAALWHVRRAAPRSPERRRGVAWVLAGAGVGLLLWAPPLIDELTHDRGNFTLLADHFGSPPDETIGLRNGAEHLLERLDPWHLLVTETQHPGTLADFIRAPSPTATRGGVVAGLWLASVGVAVWMRHRRLLALHAVLAVALGTGVVALSRIFGTPWHYLMLWGWSIGALTVVAIGWTGFAALQRVGSSEGRRAFARATRVAAVVALVSIVAGSLRLATFEGDVEPTTPDVRAGLAALMGDTIAALEAGTGAASARDARYLVSWSDSVLGGAQAFGLVNELERHGFDVGVEEVNARTAATHRVRDAGDADARVHLATGGWVARWRNVAGAVEVAHVDRRSGAERAEYEALRERVIDDLVAGGYEHLVPAVDGDLLGLALNYQLPVDIGLLIGRMLDIGGPAAIFIAPPDVGP